MGDQKYDLGEICVAVGEPPKSASHRDEASVLLQVIASGVSERAPDVAYLLRVVAHHLENGRPQELKSLVREAKKCAPDFSVFGPLAAPGNDAIRLLVSAIKYQRWTVDSVDECTIKVAMAVKNSFALIFIRQREWAARVKKRLTMKGKADAELIAQDALVAMGSSIMDAKRTVQDAMPR